MQVFNRLTINSQKKIRDIAMNEPDRLEDPEYLAKVNEALREEYSFLQETIKDEAGGAVQKLKKDLLRTLCLGSGVWNHRLALVFMP